MLKIGDFSKLSRVSIRMLRHYDDIDLLKPTLVDKFTGYRYYAEAQLLQAERIMVLKNMGFGLSMIGEILSKYGDAAEMEHFLALQKEELQQQAAAVQQKIRLLDSTIKWLRKDGNIMGYDVCLKVLPERYVASLRQVIPSYADEGQLWYQLRSETAAQPVQNAAPSYQLVIFHDGEYKESDVDAEAQVSVVGNYQATEHVAFKTVPPIQYAGATFNGGYEQISQVNEAVAKWVLDNGYEFDGPAFNIYYVSPGQTANPDEYVTEVCYPVRKK